MLAYVLLLLAMMDGKTRIKFALSPEKKYKICEAMFHGTVYKMTKGNYLESQATHENNPSTASAYCLVMVFRPWSRDGQPGRLSE